MKCLISCEFSGIVRDSFAALGWDAWSCDLLPTERPGQHFQGDVRDILNDGWDLMIAHPPCTYLSYAANGYWNRPGRAKKREEAIAFFMECANAPVEHICIENPLGIMSKAWRKHDQTIHPYFFGERELKRTCLWLKKLPKLLWFEQDDLFGNKQTVTDYPEPTYVDKTSGKKRYYTDANHGGHVRSKSFSSIAEAMAQQWTAYLQTSLAQVTRHTAGAVG